MSDHRDKHESIHARHATCDVDDGTFGLVMFFSSSPRKAAAS